MGEYGMRVLMIGAGRDVRGGVSSVVNGYYDAGLDKLCELTYLPTMEDGSKLKKLFVAVCARIRFESLIKKNDILHVHMSADSSFYRKAVFIRRAYRAGKKIIIHMHGSTFDLFYEERCNEKQKQNVRKIFAMADVVIALSEDWKTFLGKRICAEDKIQVIYNAVNIPEKYAKDYQNQDMLFLGILGKRKGTYDLLEVLPEIFAKYPDAHIYFGGDGEREQAEAVCRQKGISHNVTFLGWVRGEEKEKFLKNCSIYVLPTYHEGMPMSILEAMAYGMAIVSTYVGGIPHIVANDENGILCEAGNKKQLQNALERLLEDHRKRERLGKAGAAYIADNFDIKKNIEKIEKIYSSLLTAAESE
jgi:glycosyltransferase involved in cell wall biosynthesis